MPLRSNKEFLVVRAGSIAKKIGNKKTFFQLVDLYGPRVFNKPAIVKFEASDKHANEFYTIVAAD